MPEIIETEPRSKSLAFGSGALIGTLGGLIGLGGAEFRLPVLISLFRFRGLEAVIPNKATNLVVVGTALPFRASTVPFAAIAASWPIMINLLAGSLAGAWVGAGWATRLRSETLSRRKSSRGPADCNPSAVRRFLGSSSGIALEQPVPICARQSASLGLRKEEEQQLCRSKSASLLVCSSGRVRSGL
jgi:hypothetical protein